MGRQGDWDQKTNERGLNGGRGDNVEWRVDG